MLHHQPIVSAVSDAMKPRSQRLRLPQAELLQGNPLDLRQLLFGQLVLEAVAGEEVEADARGHAARPTLPLQGVGPGHP